MQQYGTSSNDRKNQGRTRVKVAIRVRPLLQRELVNGYKICTNIRSEKDILIGNQALLPTDKNGPRQYQYDRVFRQDSPQGDVYTHCIKQLVMSCFQGYNAAVLAYGQTGSGKTYTMGTAVSTLSDDNRLGIIPRVITDIFDQIDQRSNNTIITVTASYIELYNEHIFDLLAQSQRKNQSITIKEDRESGLVNVQGVIKEVVASPEQMLRLLEKGGMHRTTKQTNMNDVSSRSHAIFTIYMDSEPIKNDKDDKKEEGLSGITHSRFFFADLAGSQRAKKTGATGDTLKEGININLGLLELGNVISALSTIEKNKDQFITFRNSKLTRILQDALGGNSNTYMIACVSPAEFNYEQSLNTLKYASKAMNIKNKPVINRNKMDMLKQQNVQLKNQNKKLKRMLEEKGVKFQSDDRDDQMIAEGKILKEENRMLNRKYNQCLVELQTAKHKLNELQIKMYDVRREKDLMQLTFEELVRQNPKLAQGDAASQLRGRFQQNQRQKVEVLEKYMQQIQALETKVVDKDNLFSQLQTQYNSLLQNSKKDEQLLIKKHNMLYAIGRQNNKLKQQIARLSDGEVLQQHIPDQIVSQEMQAVMQQQNLEHDDLMRQHEQDYNQKQQKTKEELQQVDRYILQKQQFLQRISRQQITLQTQVISSMKNEYHQKINLLQKERKQLLKQKDEGSLVEKNKFMNKIQNLQGELKDYRKKAKEQRNMERQVQTQSSRIRDLAEEIKKFKMQKMELHRKLKEDRDHFDKLKNKRVKQLLHARKENMKKQNQIRKIKIKTFRNQQALKKKDQELKRAKKVTQALKGFVKPSTRSSITRKESTNVVLPPHPTQQDLKMFDKMQNEFVGKICRQIHFQIDRQQQIQSLHTQLSQAQSQLKDLVNELTSFRIKKERIDLKAQEQELSQSQIQQRVSLSLIVKELQQRLEVCQSRIAERQQSDLFRETVQYFDIEATVLFNKQYQSVQALRSFVRALMHSIRTYIFQNCKLLTQHKTDTHQIQRLRERVKEERQNLMNLNAEYHRSLAQMRDDSINRSYSEQPEPPATGLRRLDQKQKKQLQRKFQDLAKSNRHLTSQLQKTRRKCEVVQDKYSNIKNLVSKDKNIGRQEDSSFIKQQKKLQKQASNKQLIDQLDGMIQNIDRLKKVKSVSALEEVVEQKDNEGDVVNRWECLWKVDAHASGVLSVAVHSNFLISTATKSIKIWDLQSRKLIAQLQAPGAVKHVMIDPQRRLFFTTCQKSITIWNLISLQVEGVLKCHKDEVRILHNWGDYIFSGGKGTPSSGSLLIWDLRKLNPNQALQQKERNQDIFALTSASNVLYYGTRNRSVRRMAIGSWDILSPFQPPHLDSISGLTIAGNKLISGSKDKHLRLWDTTHALNNNKHTFHAFNDYVTTVQSPPHSSIFYAGSKDGQIKTCFTKNDRIQLLGGILAHTQSINSICTLDDNPLSLITASQDKVIKLWQPTKQTMQNISKQSLFE